ncbi:MAG: DUF2339 domain-containing protein [Gemmatimonadales bacterium]
MTESDRLDRLVSRVETLERLVRQLVADRGAPSAPPEPSPPTPPPVARAVSATLRATPAPVPPPRPRVRPAPGLDGEQWIGQRGLLTVGVAALVLALAYLLKLSFDRGWVSPAVRCASGAACGAVVGAVGWRLERRGLRTYGAGLIGAGAGMIYLAVWAAGRLYGFLPPPSAITALALVSLGLASLAYAVDVEVLGATAALGAFLAPVAIGPPSSNPDLLLLYLGVMGLALGAVAALKRWRIASIVILLGYFGLGIQAAQDAHSVVSLLFAIVGGGGGIWVGLREQWWESRLVAFGGGWSALGAAASALGPGGLLIVGGVALTAPVWHHGLTHAVLPFGERDPTRASWREAAYFYVTPWLLSWAVGRLSLGALEAHPGLAEAIVAVAYLSVAFGRSREPFALVAAALAGVAALREWPGLHAVWALGALAVLWALLGRRLRRTDWERYGAVTLVVAIVQLWVVASDGSRHGAPAFVDTWAITLWALTALTTAWGMGVLGGATEDRTLRTLRRAAWPLAGTMLFVGVTGELLRYFSQSDLARDTQALAGGLAVSSWWILFAAGLLLVGFQRGLKPVRVAGLWVTALAVGKVLLVDLNSLDALYRVVSVLLLGVVSLGVAYLYHRRARPAV